MRSIEFATLLEELSWLFEDKREFILSRQSEQLVNAYRAETGQEAEASAVIDVLIGALPNPNDQSFLVWIVNQYLKNQFKSNEVESIKELLTNFARVKPKLEKKDIGQYKTVEDLRVTVDALKDADLRSNKEKERQFRDTLFKTGEAELIHRDPELIVISPKTHRASCYFGTNTKWCTAAKDRSDSFDRYSKYGTLYIFIYQKKKFQLHLSKRNNDFEFRDDADVKINESLQMELILKVPKLVELIKTQHPTMYGKLKMYSIEKHGIEDTYEIANDPFLALQYAQTFIKGRWPEGEKAIAANAETAFTYATTVVKGRWPEGEKAISLVPKFAFKYASKIIKGRWIKGEKAIATNPAIASRYALKIIKGRWPDGEKAIASRPTPALSYAAEIIKGRWPEGEKAILKKPEAAAYYASQILGERWPEGEKVILKKPAEIVKYAINVVKGRWPEGEKVLLNGPAEHIPQYSAKVIKGRWPEAETILLADPNAAFHAAEYATTTIKGRWPEAEEKIAADSMSAYRYARDVIKGRWPECERWLLKNNDTYYLLHYTKLIGKRWPAAEQVILAEKNPWKLAAYASEFFNGNWPAAEESVRDDPEKHSAYLTALQQ